MRKINFLLLLALAGSVYGEEWRPLPGTTLTQLLDSRWANKAGYLGVGEIVGTAGLSWPDGRQAVNTTILIRQVGEGHMFRCIDYFDVDMRHTGHRCFEFREARDE